MSTPALTQKQCEAVADILVLAMCIDGHFSLLEEDKIQEKIAKLDWDPDSTPSHHINLSIARARAVVDSPTARQSYLQARSEVLGTAEVKQYAVDKAEGVLQADGLKSEEGAFVTELRAAFGL